MYQCLDRGQVVSILEEVKFLLSCQNDEIFTSLSNSVEMSIDLIRTQFWYNPNDVFDALLNSYETLREALIHSLMLAFVKEDQDYSCFQISYVPFTSRFQVFINHRTPAMASISRYARIETLIRFQAELRDATQRCYEEQDTTY